MARSNHRARLQQVGRGGFTLIELLISLTIGALVVAAALSFAMSTVRGTEGNKLREEVYRNARFIQMSLQRDLQTAGVGIESQVDFGTLDVFNDTIVMLAVPWEPQFAPAHDVVPYPGTDNPLNPGGTCGATCIDLDYDAGGSYDFAAGDLARLQVNTERRLLIITGVRDIGTRFQIDFLADTTILHYQAAFAGGLQLDRFQSTVQKLQSVVYFETDSILYRSQSWTAAGAMEPAPVAFGVIAWDAWLIFTDGDELVTGDATDSDVTNDYDDMLGVLIEPTLAAGQVDLRVNQGNLFTRDYTWRIMPRNLMYERNR